MNLTDLSMRNDAYIIKYMDDKRDTMVSPYQCFWCDKEHKGSSQAKFDRFKTHILKCRFRSFHNVSEKKSLKPAIYPVCPPPEKYKYYRGSLAGMNGCYEYHYDRLGVQGFENTILYNFMDKFLARNLKSGDEDYHQSISLCNVPPGTPPPLETYKEIFKLNSRTWRVKKNKEATPVFLNDVELFHFLLEEYRPLFKYALSEVVKTDSYDFWFMMINNKRTNANKTRRDFDIKNGLCPGGYMGYPFTRFNFDA